MKLKLKCTYTGIYLDDKGALTGDASFEVQTAPDDHRTSLHLPNPGNYFKVGEYYELTLTKVE